MEFIKSLTFYFSTETMTKANFHMEFAIFEGIAIQNVLTQKELGKAAEQYLKKLVNRGDDYLDIVSGCVKVLEQTAKELTKDFGKGQINIRRMAEKYGEDKASSLTYRWLTIICLLVRMDVGFPEYEGLICRCGKEETNKAYRAVMKKFKETGEDHCNFQLDIVDEE
jgi:hypothetical protein